MEASVELNYPVDVAVLTKSNCMGSDIRVKEVEVCESILVSGRARAAASIERCSSFLAQKDVTSSVNALESTSWDRVTSPEEHKIQLPRLPIRDISKQLHYGGSNSPSWIPRPEEVLVQRKGGKVSRSSSGCSKRQRLAPLEEATEFAGVDDIKDLSDKLASLPSKCDSHEKNQLAKQKNISSRRGDRRNFKVSVKSKSDSFSVKAGLASFSSAAGGNNFNGLYGLKTDVQDVTKLVDDISLNDLLDGTYECPTFGNDKGKKAANMAENILHSVRKACSILQLSRPAQFQRVAETDGCSNEKMPTCSSNSVSIVENGDSSTTDLSSCNKDSSSKPETPANLLDFSFDQPKDTLERLALPPPKDLESLLLDAAKPAVSSRNAHDPRPGKQISRRASLPTFPWSHNFSGHGRSNSDAVKCLPSRGTCQGRWSRIWDAYDSHSTASDCLLNLESLAYDETLVPCQRPNLIQENHFDSFKHVPCGCGLSSSSASMTSNVVLESGGDLKSQGKVEQCPSLLDAAQTLCDISTHMSRLNQDGMMRWPQKLSQKAMKARRTKSNEKPEEIFTASTSLMESGHTSRSDVDQVMPLKRPKLSTVVDKKDLGRINGLRKGPINWSAPRSNRSFPSKSTGDSMAETYILKQSCLMPPPAKVLNRTCNGHQKVRKFMQMD